MPEAQPFALKIFLSYQFSSSLELFIFKPEPCISSYSLSETISSSVFIFRSICLTWLQIFFIFAPCWPRCFMETPVKEGFWLSVNLLQSLMLKRVESEWLAQDFHAWERIKPWVSLLLVQDLNHYITLALAVPGSVLQLTLLLGLSEGSRKETNWGLTQENDNTKQDGN